MRKSVFPTWDHHWLDKERQDDGLTHMESDCISNTFIRHGLDTDFETLHVERSDHWCVAVVKAGKREFIFTFQASPFINGSVIANWSPFASVMHTEVESE